LITVYSLLFTVETVERKKRLAAEVVDKAATKAEKEKI